MTSTTPNTTIKGGQILTDDQLGYLWVTVNQGWGIMPCELIRKYARAVEADICTALAGPARAPLVEDVRVAMRKAFSLGQTYWQQADSESVSQNSKSDETARSFKQLVADTCDALAAGIAQPAAPSEQAGELPPLPWLSDAEIRGIVQRGGIRYSSLQSCDEMAAIALVRECEEKARATLAARQAPASTLTQSRDRELWTDEQRANYRANKALVYRCTICCARSGEPHLLSCSEQGICGA